MNSSILNQSHCPEVVVPNPVFFTIGAVSFAENFLVVVAVIRNRNLHSPMYCFICSLAAFHAIASLTKTLENLMIVFADVGHLNKKGSSETTLDDAIDSLLCMSFLGSFFSILAIAVDRYVWSSWIWKQISYLKMVYFIVWRMVFMARWTYSTLGYSSPKISFSKA